MSTPLRLLVAEDSDDDALLLVRTLRQADFVVTHERVSSASSLREALDRQTWDVVISDYSMPGFSGDDALTIVRGAQPDVPFIFVSGSIGEDIAVAAMRSGANDYVMKNNLRRLAPAIARELRDADERRQRRLAEGRLRTTTETLHAMFAASPLAIIITAPDGTVDLWNPAAERLFGWPESEVLGRPNPTIPPDGAADAIEGRALAEGAPRVGRETQRLCRDGQLIDVNLSVATIRDDAQGAARLVVVAQDIRDRKRLEAQFLQAQKMEAVGRLAGGIAHDFNNLLTVITSYAEFLLEELPSHDGRRDDVQQIRSAADTATALSRQLLVFSRQHALQPQVVVLNDLVHGTTKLVRRLIGANVELVEDLDTDTGFVEIDPGQIDQIVMNLAINARDAMPAGGRLVITTRNVTLDRGEDSPSAHVMLAVADNGVGMDEQTRVRIFEPFFTTKAVGKGTGLGLSTVYTIVQQCDGHIEVASEPGRGTTFRVYIPRVGAASVTAAVARRPLESMRGAEVVLLVEDTAAVRSAARVVLERLGYTVLEAPDGPTALRLASKVQGSIDLLLTDYMMPGMNGLELAARFRAARPETKVVVSSGYSDGAVRPAELDHTMPYLQKPFSPESLGAIVRDTLDGMPRS